MPILVTTGANRDATVLYYGSTDLTQGQTGAGFITVETRDVAGVVLAYHGIWQPSCWLALITCCFQQLRTYREGASSTLFILVRQGCPLLWHGSQQFIPDHQTRMKRPLRLGQWEEYNLAQWSPPHYQWYRIPDQCLLICVRALRPEVK